MFKLVVEKAEKPEIKLPTSIGSSEKQESSRKNIYFCFIDYGKDFDVVEHNKLENSSRDEEILQNSSRPPYLPPEESVCRSRDKS